jgi:hypothetical protein
MADPPLPVESFPDMAAAAARAVTRANTALAGASVDRMLSGGFGDIYFLRRARFDWRFYLTVDRGRVVFFFFRSTSPTEVVLDATTSFTFEPLPPSTLPPPSGPLSYRWVLPPFVIPAPDAAQVRLWAPDGADPGRTLFIALGPSREHVLAVHFRTDIEADFAFSGTDGRITFRSGDATWPLRPVLALLREFSAWAQADTSQGVEVAFVPAAGADAPDVIRILVALATGWTAASEGAHADLARRSPLAQAYAVGDMDARVLLRLTTDSRLATTDEDDPFQLVMQLRVGPREGGVHATAVIKPPDFLAAGPLHAAFGRLFRSTDVVRPLRSAIDDRELSDEALTDFLAAPASTWAVFRVARRQTHDSDVSVWKGERAARAFLLIAQVDVVVDASGDDPDLRLADHPRIQVLYWGPADVEQVPALGDAGRYVVRLLAQIRRWIALAG